MGTRMSIRAPADYDLPRDVCSYGYFLLAPNVWDLDALTMTRTLGLDDGTATIVLSQPDGRGGPVRAISDRALSRKEQSEAKRLIARMLNLHDDGLKAFHTLDPRWKKSGRGRLFRSPTLFEDMVKTITSCNVTWPSTVNMNRRLCEVINPGFPTPGQMARRRPQSLRSRCGVGYRDVRLVELGKMFHRGEIDEAWLADPDSDDQAVFKKLLELPGVGPYAASNIMMLLGRYSRLAIDSESIRHGKDVLGFKGTERQIAKKLEKHYEPFGRHKFRSYWFERMEHYEAKEGPARTWRHRPSA